MDQLEKYLKSNDLIYSDFYNDTNSKLIWEYWWGTGPEIIVNCIKLDYTQKQKLSPPKQSISSENDTRIRFEIGELVNFQNDFNSGKVNWEIVLEKLSNLKGKAWTTRNWKEKRASLIKKSCERCGSSNDGMVIQHIRQPRKPDTVIKQYKSCYDNVFNEWLKDHPISINTSAYPVDTPSCPKCGSQTIRFRKTKNSWICLSKIVGLKCGYEFEKPIYRFSIHTINSVEKNELKIKFKQFLESNGLAEKLINECFSDLFDYLNMTQTKTLCAKCAYLEDKRRI